MKNHHNLADRVNRLTVAEQRQFEARMQQKQMKEFMGVSLHIYSSHNKRAPSHNLGSLFRIIRSSSLHYPKPNPLQLVTAIALARQVHYQSFAYVTHSVLFNTSASFGTLQIHY
jgi:hypothetical protein